MLHTHRTSLSQQHRTQWHFTLALVYTAVSILIILSCMFHSYILKLILQCCPAKKTKRKAIEKTSAYPPQPAQRTHETRTDDYKGMWPSRRIHCKRVKETRIQGTIPARLRDYGLITERSETSADSSATGQPPKSDTLLSANHLARDNKASYSAGNKNLYEFWKNVTILYFILLYAFCVLFNWVTLYM